MLLRSFAILTLVLFATNCQAENPEIKIWPNGIPDSSVIMSDDAINAAKAKTTTERIAYVDDPTITVYQPAAGKANGCAVIVCPGGGYNILAWPKEGLEVAEWFNSIGVTAFVLKYRVPRRVPDNIHWEPMQDVQRAIRMVRNDAKTWNIDPNRIGTLGFSAGGHLTVMSGTHYDTKCYEPIDEIDKVSARPNFICPIYAAYLGDDYDDRKEAKLGSLVKITKNTPPTFMAVTWDDALRGAQSALLFAELRKNKVPAELHVYSKGGHGYGMRPSKDPVSKWNRNLKDWLQVSGLLEKKSN